MNYVNCENMICDLFAENYHREDTEKMELLESWWNDAAEVSWLNIHQCCINCSEGDNKFRETDPVSEINSSDMMLDKVWEQVSVDQFFFQLKSSLNTMEKRGPSIRRSMSFSQGKI